jgi:hypothetical protein
MEFYKTTAQKQQKSALLSRAYVHLTVNLAASKALYEIINTNLAFQPMSDNEFRHKFLTLAMDYMEEQNQKEISLAEFNKAFFISLESFLINEVKNNVMFTTKNKN